MSEQAPQPMHELKGTEGQHDHVQYAAAEIPSSTPDSPTLEQSSLPAVAGEGLEDTELRASTETAEEQREAYAAWLERRDIDPASTPHLTMSHREFEMFRNAPTSYQGYTRELYGIPQGDQDNCQYALVDIEPEAPDQPHQPLLTIVNEADFGTVIDREVVDMDFEQPDSDPDNPSTPERPAGALKTVDISKTLVESGQGLRAFAETLMREQTTDPFSTQNGDIGIRAGGLMPGQQDAYVWTTNPITKSVELTLAFPGQYDSVCVVRGQSREAANGKPGMAQIDNPQEVFKIEGENLAELQQIYRDLYQQPHYALTDAQREDRDQLYDGYLRHLISKQAESNERQEQARRDDEYRRYHQPQLRAREIPRS